LANKVIFYMVRQLKRDSIFLLCLNKCLLVVYLRLKSLETRLEIWLKKRDVIIYNRNSRPKRADVKGNPKGNAELSKKGNWNQCNFAIVFLITFFLLRFSYYVFLITFFLIRFSYYGHLITFFLIRFSYYVCPSKK
jgi:hypothetical protein